MWEEGRDLSCTCCPTGVHQGPRTEQGSHPVPREQADTGATGLLYRGELKDLHGEWGMLSPILGRRPGALGYLGF